MACVFCSKLDDLKLMQSCLSSSTTPVLPFHVKISLEGEPVHFAGLQKLQAPIPATRIIFSF